MARLIDVEPFDLISFQATGDTAYDQGFEDGVRFVAEKLDASPTIDAIPVEWIESRIAMAPNTLLASCSMSILQGWQKYKMEQEVQDAKM